MYKADIEKGSHGQLEMLVGGLAEAWKKAVEWSRWRIFSAEAKNYIWVIHLRVWQAEYASYELAEKNSAQCREETITISPPEPPCASKEGHAWELRCTNWDDGAVFREFACSNCGIIRRDCKPIECSRHSHSVEYSIPDYVVDASVNFGGRDISLLEMQMKMKNRY